MLETGLLKCSKDGLRWSTSWTIPSTAYDNAQPSCDDRATSQNFSTCAQVNNRHARWPATTHDHHVITYDNRASSWSCEGRTITIATWSIVDQRMVLHTNMYEDMPPLIVWRLETHQSVGPDNIPPRPLKQVADIIAISNQVVISGFT